jgi:hypothetical protein
MRRLHPSALAALVALGLGSLTLGCGGAPKPEPEIAPSVDEATYALDYPATLTGLVTQLGSREADAKRAREGWSKLPAELGGVDKKAVLSIVRKANRAGRSRAYVERRREFDGTNDFYGEARDTLTKKPAGAAQYVVKQKGFDVDVGSPVVHAVEESYGKALEKRLRAHNEAFVDIERLREGAGKEKTALLEQRADEIAFASYVVHIDLVERKVRIRAMLEEAEGVKKTLERTAEEERAFQNEGKRSASEKKASEERLTAVRSALGRIDAAVTQGKTLSEGLEQRIRDAQDAHEKAIAELEKSLGGGG